jgi:hypothetical protein
MSWSSSRVRDRCPIQFSGCLNPLLPRSLVVLGLTQLIEASKAVQFQYCCSAAVGRRERARSLLRPNEGMTRQGQARGSSWTVRRLASAVAVGPDRRVVGEGGGGGGNGQNTHP